MELIKDIAVCIVIALVSFLYFFRFIIPMLRPYMQPLLHILNIITTSNTRLNLPPAPPAWPFIGHLHLLGSMPHQSFANLAHKYGPLMLLKLGSVPTLVVSSDVLAKEFLKTHDLTFASRPKLLAGKILFYDYKDVVFAEYGPYWRDMKRLCRWELLAPKRIEESTHIRLEEAYRMVKSIRNQYCSNSRVKEAAVDVRSYVSSLSCSIIARMIFNYDYFASESKAALEFQETVREAFYLAGASDLGDLNSWIGWLDVQGIKRRMKRVRKRMDALLDKILEEHLQNTIKLDNQAEKDAAAAASTRHEDFVDVLLSVRRGGSYQSLDKDGIKALVFDMLSGGVDTMAVAIEWALSEIVANPRVQQAAHEELDKVVGRERKVSEEDLPQLNYLQWIVKETMRLHPPAPTTLPHECREPIQVKGYDIAAGTRLVVNMWAIGRDPKTWEKASEFLPERFAGSKVEVYGNDFQLIPFGSGKRACPAISLAMPTVRLGLAVLLQGFQWSCLPSQTTLDMSEIYRATLLRAVPLLAVAHPRLPHHLYD